jgi:stage V sporulation protein B
LPLLAISYLFSTSIIILLFGGVYAGAAGPFRILLVGAFFFGIFNLNSGVFQGLGRPAIPMRILMLAAFLDVFLNVALIPRYALMGAAFATATSMAFAGITSMVLLPKALSG